MALNYSCGLQSTLQGRRDHPYFIYKKRAVYKIVSFARKWMELEINMLRDIDQVLKNKHHTFSLIYGIWI
jgi:hypothetical protein